MAILKRLWKSYWHAVFAPLAEDEKKDWQPFQF